MKLSNFIYSLTLCLCLMMIGQKVYAQDTKLITNAGQLECNKPAEGANLGYLIDNDANTSFRSDANDTGATERHYLTVDMTSRQSGYIRLEAKARISNRNRNIVTTLQVEGSNDKNSWTVVEGNLSLSNLGMGDDVATGLIYLKSNYRYLRFSVNRNVNYDGTDPTVLGDIKTRIISFSEFQLYKETSVTTPNYKWLKDLTDGIHYVRVKITDMPGNNLSAGTYYMNKDFRPNTSQTVLAVIKQGNKAMLADPGSVSDKMSFSVENGFALKGKGDDHFYRYGEKGEYGYSDAQLLLRKKTKDLTDLDKTIKNFTGVDFASPFIAKKNSESTSVTIPDSEMDDAHAVDSVIPGTTLYSRNKSRNVFCYIDIQEDGKLRFTLANNTAQNNVYNLNQEGEAVYCTNPYYNTALPNEWSHALYLKFARSGNNTAHFVPTTNEAEGIKIELELADVNFVHYEGDAYSGTVTGQRPDELNYPSGNAYKTHADDSRINNDAASIQRTHETVYEKWVYPGQTIKLLPFTDFESATQYEEKYTRWYDYTTGMKSSRLDFGTQSMLTLADGVFGGSYITGNRANGTYANYVSDKNATAETLGIVAMDASLHYNNNAITYNDNKVSIKEPNLTFRTVFVIKNAKLRADILSLKSSNYAELHKERLQAPEGTPFQYRMPNGENKNYDQKSSTGYWYKKSDGTYAEVYHYLIETWKDGTKIGTSTVRSRGGDNIVKGANDRNNIDRTLYLKKPEAGFYTIKIYAIEYNGTTVKNIYYCNEDETDENRLLLMEYDLEIMSKARGNMITEEELINTPELAHQLPANMERLYGAPTTVVNFDDIQVDQLTISGSNKYYKWPRKWEDSSYGFAFRNFTSQGDYNMYVVINNTDASRYHDGSTGTGVKHDRLWYDTNGAKEGFMYYTNAAGDPGKMTVLNIGNDFCPNTTVYVSAWVMECSKTSETANVVFTFKGVDSNGSETALGSFATGYVTGGNNHYSDNTNPDHRGLWHHVYYSFKPQIVDKTMFDHYIISVDNNCVNSSGADYVVDDIRAFVVKPTIRAQQLEPLCDKTPETKLLLTSPWDGVVEAFAVQEPETSDKTKYTEVDYCFLDKEKYDKAMEGYEDLDFDHQRQKYIDAFNTALVRNSYPNNTETYGILKFYNFYEDNEEYDPTKDYSEVYNQATRANISDETMLVFPSKATDANMAPGKTYIVAMRRHDGEEPNAQAFDLKANCSASSEFTVITSGVIKIDGEMISEQQDEEYCSNLTPIITIDMTGISNLGVIQETKNSYFDWYFGSYEEYTKAEFNGKHLSAAMEVFRNKYPTIKYEQFEAEAIIDSEFTAEDKACIKHFMEVGDLVLYKNQEVISTYDHFNKPAEDSDRVYVTAIPINPTPDRIDIRYCLNPLEISIKVSKRKPSMLNGDDKKNFYPVAMRVVPLRIGLTQLNSIRIDKLGATPKNVLYMPLREVTCTAEGIHKLKMAEDRDIYLIASDDPQIQEGTSGAKDIENTDVKVIGSVNKIEADAANAGQEKNFSELAFIKDFKFREGYEYTIKFRFDEEHESTAGEKSDICPGDVVCIIKVVPEYQMWTGAVNSNWNNDGNWRRVWTAELLGTAAATADFTIDGGTNDNEHSFVPADFTKVIIPADAKNVPKLYNVRKEGNLEVIHYPQGTGASNFIKSMYADEHIGGVTTDINYDMSSVNKNNHIACRSWYDHTCQYIHFNSEAQMLSQQNLFYEKAWADFEVEPNKWSTVGSPLINVVSGDLYLPTETARQDTPLFEDITFDTNLHDRFHPAVFQRRWNAENAKILHLSGEETSAMVALDWSEVYNDVNVNYTSGVGFSIKPDVSMMPAGKQPAKVKFRLPKGDTDYWYWNPDHQDGDRNNETVRRENDPLINGERTHRLADLKNVYAQQVVQNDPSTNYFLIGNPLMCYLDMERFFDANPILDRKYWIVTGKGQQYAQFDENTEGYVGSVDNQYLAPFQSFFVKLATTSSDTFTPQFNNEMMVAKLAGGTYESVTAQVTSNPAKEGYLTVCAEDEDGNESTMMLTDGAELQISGIEALFDSNLRQSGYPMVYGNVRGEAMSLTTIMPGDTIPVAVSGLRGMTTLKLKGAEEFTTDLYVIDSETGESRLLTSDMELTQETSGVRYYIAAEPTDIDSEFVALLPQLKIEGNTLKVFPPEGETIESIHIYQVGGALVAAENNISGVYSINLKNDVYLIAIKYNGRALNYKIVI